MKKILIPLLILPVVLSPFVGNTLGVTGTIVASGEKKIIKKPQLTQTQLTKIQLQRKIASLASELVNLKKKIHTTKSRIERKTRMNLSHSIDDSSLENLMKQYSEKEKTVSELKKKLDDTASGAIQKIGE